jgi:transcriptional regulator with XRE-family HTH domain
MNLKEARFKKNQTQFDLRIKTGISQTKISHFERGYLVPSEDEKARLAKALGVKDLRWDNE